jgi:hypothetical protein
VRAVVTGWLGFCALGAGLIHLALVIGTPLLFGMPLLLIGLAEIVWGVFALTAPALPVPRIARIAAVVPLLFWVVVLLVDSGSPLPGAGVLPMLLSGLLDLAIAIGITAMLRRRAATDPPPLRPASHLLALGGGALVVAAVTISALAASGALPTGITLDLPGHGH